VATAQVNDIVAAIFREKLRTSASPAGGLPVLAAAHGGCCTHKQFRYHAAPLRHLTDG
jgi:acetyl esterase/lipase